MIRRSEWTDGLLRCVGTPYVHQGRRIGRGLDCVGPLIVNAREFGIVPPSFDINGYSRQPDGRMRELLEQHLVRISEPELLPGDLVLMRLRVDDQPRHVAYVVGERYGEREYLHADSLNRRVRIERIKPRGGMYRYVQGYRVPGIEA